MSTAAHEIYQSIFTSEPSTDETEERTLDAALEVLTEFGFRRSSMEEVARRAGLSRVTIYRKFADKDALVQAVILRECRRSLSSIVQEIAALPSAEARFVRGFVRTVAVARAHPLFRRMLDGEPDIVLPKYVAISASQSIDLGRETMRGIIGAMQTQGYFAGLDPAFMAELLIRMWHSIVLTPSTLISPENEKSLTAFAKDFLYPLLSAKNKGKGGKS